MEESTLARTLDLLSEAIADLKQSTSDEHQRLAGSLATVVLLLKEQGRQTARTIDFATTQQHRELMNLRGAVSALMKIPPPQPSVEIAAEAESRDDEVSVVNLKLPGVRKMLPVPNRLIWAMIAGPVGAIMGWVTHWLAVITQHR